MQCRYCKDTKKIELFTSVVDCTECKTEDRLHYFVYLVMINKTAILGTIDHLDPNDYAIIGKGSFNDCQILDAMFANIFINGINVSLVNQNRRYIGYYKAFTIMFDEMLQVFELWDNTINDTIDLALLSMTHEYIDNEKFDFKWDIYKVCLWLYYKTCHWRKI